MQAALTIIIIIWVFLRTKALVFLTFIKAIAYHGSTDKKEALRMKLLITGNSERDRFLKSLCRQRGIELPSHGPWDAVILPLPFSRLSQEEADLFPRGQRVFCGMTDEAFDRLAKKRGWKLHRILQDESYTKENAALTAEGAVWAAMDGGIKSLQASKCLVAGYGRIGKELVSRLRLLGALVTVSARREDARREAGSGSVTIEKIPEVIGKMDYVFNTVPSPIILDGALKRLSPNALLIELASPPYGIDLENAGKRGLRARLESGLPGRLFPLSAAQTVLSYIEREMQHE